jgi:hypothetical protein
MITVYACVLGGMPKPFTGESFTVGQIKTAMALENYTAKVNGDSVDTDTQLENGNLVVFTQAVKGGNN